jgi:hypothetical protein
MCGCNGELIPNKNFPLCDKHKNSTDMDRALMHFITYRNYTLDYCKSRLIGDYVKVLEDNWEEYKILERFT